MKEGIRAPQASIMRMPSHTISRCFPAGWRMSHCAVIAAGLALALASGCASKERGEAGESASVSAPAASAPSSGGASAGAGSAAKGDAAAQTTQVAATPRKIIYTASVSLVADDFAQTARNIVRDAKARNGYIAENNLSGTPGQPREGTWKIRIPLTQFDAFLAALGKMGELENTNITSEDVSEEFYDVRARLQNKRAEEARLLELLQKATGKLSDVLTVEKEISRVREEIERMEGRIRFLSNQTDLATVTITVREASPMAKPKAPPTFATQIGQAFAGSLGALGNFTRGLIIAVVAIVPWLIVPGFILFFALRHRKKRPTPPHHPPYPQPPHSR